MAAAVAVAYGGGTWWAGSKMKSSYDTVFDELPKQTALVRVVDRQYERGFFGAASTVTLELGCAADAQEEKGGADRGADSTPPQPVRITWRDTIHHGPLVRGTFAAATVDGELVLDAKAQAEAEKLFGKAKPVTAHTRVAFSGDHTSELTIAPAKLDEEGKGQLAWQGARARIDVNAARTRVHYDLTMPGLDFNDAAGSLQLKMGKLTAKADMDTSAGWFLATGKTEGRLESFEFSAPKGLGRTDSDAHKPLPTVLLQNIDMQGEASIKDGLYASDGSIKGQGKIGETTVDKFEMSSSARRIHAAGYKKLADTWMRSNAAAGCGQGGSLASQAALKTLVDQLAPDLKAMAKYSPEIGLDRMRVEIDGKRGEVSYTAGMVGVTDEDLQAPGTALLMKRGVLKANARLPVKWLEQLAAAGADSGQTPPPDLVAGLVQQGEDKGLIRRDGDDVTGQIEFSAGSLKINGKPLSALGK